MHQHGQEAHVGQIAIVADKRPALCLHQIAAKASEFRTRILALDGLHQVTGMKVATGLSGYQIVLQDCKDLRASSEGVCVISSCRGVTAAMPWSSAQ